MEATRLSAMSADDGMGMASRALLTLRPMPLLAAFAMVCRLADVLIVEDPVILDGLFLCSKIVIGRSAPGQAERNCHQCNGEARHKSPFQNK